MSKTDRDDAEKTVLSPSVAMPLPQSRLGRFDIIRPLGQGGMGEVFLVTDREHPDRGRFALKTIFPELMQDREIVSRFESEAKMLSSIQHPNVVQLIEWGTFIQNEKQIHFMAMEYIDGISLHTLARRRRLSLADALNIAGQAAKGLHAIHTSRVVHRDLKPANIMITRDGLAKIIDFGIAKPASMGMATDDDPERGFKTKTGMVIGTVNYIAPEILRGEPASIATDVYALGLIIWEMVNGVTPFKSKTLAETMARVTGEALEWSDAIFDIAPPGFTKLVNRLAAKDEQKRIGNALIAADEIDRVASNTNWPGRFGRRARFDIDVQWAPETIEQIRALGVKDSDIGFVLQEIEGRMLDQDDSRLALSQLITVEPDLLRKSIDSYKSMRYQAAMTKATRVREQLGSSPTPGGTASVPSRKTNPSKSSQSAFLRKAASLIISLTLVAGTGLYVFSRARTRIRDVASENQKMMDGLNSLIAKQTNIVEPVTTRGSELAYVVTTQTLSGSELVVQENYKISGYSADEIDWTVNGHVAIKTPRNLIPLETFFSPIYRKAGVAVEEKNIEPLVAFKVGQTFSIELYDPTSKSTEETRCTILSSRRQQLVHRLHETWKIECLRKVMRDGNVTHRILEVYEYIPAISAVYSVSVKVDEMATGGTIAASTTRRAELHLELSKLEQSNPKDLSPW